MESGMLINFELYQKEAYTFKKYSDAIYPVIALGEECGEVQGLVAKAIRKHDDMHSLDRQQMMDELGDVLWNLSAVCSEYGMRLEEVARYNLSKLEHRNSTNQIVERADES